MGDPAQYAQYQQYYAYMQQQAQYNPQYAMQLQQYYAQYGGPGYPPQPGHHLPHQPPPPPNYAPGAGHGYQGEEQTAEWIVISYTLCDIYTCFSTGLALYWGIVVNEYQDEGDFDGKKVVLVFLYPFTKTREFDHKEFCEK